MTATRLDQAGATLIELLVSSSVLIIIVLLLAQQRVALKQFTHRQAELDATTMMVESIMDQIRARIQIFPKSYSFNIAWDSTPLNTLVATAQASWPLAWSKTFLGKREDCTVCPGRAIYYVYQTQIQSGSDDISHHYQGLYRVRLILYHPTLFGSSEAREFRFLVPSR